MNKGLIISAAILVSPFAALADDTTSDDPDASIETMTVVGTRTERAINEVAATVSVITAEDIEEELVRDISDLVRYQPGISVGGTGSRFGLGGFNIRGIGDNRVLTLVDGVRIAEEFSFGPFLSSRRDFVDVDSLNRVEIARGPVSSLYGGDALGGVVAFTTKSPQDYLGEAGWFGSLKTGYDSANEGTVATGTLAIGNESLAGLVVYTRRDSEETETAGSTGGFGTNREQADPQENASSNIVAKVAFSPSTNHTITLGIDLYDNETDTDLFSNFGTFSRGTLINQRFAEDERERERYSLAYRYQSETWLADQIQATVYQQSSETNQLTTELRTPAAPGSAPQNRFRDSSFEQDIEGVYIQLGKSINASFGNHYLTYGAEYYAAESESLRNGATFDLAGNSLFEFFPFPTRDFPPTEVTQTAFFIQDEITLLDGKLLLSPGLRYDRFEADTDADPIFLIGNPGTPLPEDYDDSETTAKLGVVYFFSDRISGFAQYSQGFRAPPYDDVNVGFTNFAGGYKTVSNANLESERSTGLELGMRIHSQSTELTFSVFRNDYEDFIESLALAPQFAQFGGVDPADGLRTFQSINRAEVTIDGAELSAQVNLGELSSLLNGFTFRTGIAYADGEDTDLDTPLNSVEPLTGIFGLGYQSPSERWGAEVIWTLVDAKSNSDIDPNDQRLPTSGYGIVDLITHIRFNEQVKVDIGLFNIGDKEYIRWRDTNSIGADAPGRFSQPGFNAAATLSVAL